MSEQPIYLTREGYQKLLEELEYLRTVRRQEIAKRLNLAMDEGNYDENAEYEAAKTEQAFVEGRIMMLESMLRRAVIIEETTGPKTFVTLGSWVTIQEEGSSTPERYQVVGSAEADPARGRISNESPLGQALLGRQVGDVITVNAPDGVLRFRILRIE
ncbi:transcription elongation factor GreA [Thermoflexus sp.]|uniref:transcription elongation factor GreA n=1 Tax=Thermoflexus sp. TaxID=1969742 RepID=UPI0017727A3A|nr:transcription elongation factor GreA [Thermoflexus sp.]